MSIKQTYTFIPLYKKYKPIYEDIFVFNQCAFCLSYIGQYSKQVNFHNSIYSKYPKLYIEINRNIYSALYHWRLTVLNEVTVEWIMC